MGIPGHDVVSMLYAIRCTAESHLAQVEEGRFAGLEGRLEHAESALKSAFAKSHEALQVTRRIRILAAGGQAVPGSAGTGCSNLSRNVPGTEGKIPMECCASVFHVWNMVRKFMMPEIVKKNAEVITRIPENFPMIVCRSRSLLEILVNLAHNALQAMEGSGKLILRAEYGLSAEHGPCAVITVADTGTGIPEGLVSNLFSPFVSTKPAGEGNGLGLSLVKELVHQNSGRLSLASTCGSGTAFILEFPFGKQV